MVKVKQTSNSFSWTSFYIEFADKLLQYRERRQELLNLLEEAYATLDINFPFTEQGKTIEDICPFTVFGCFNKGITNKNRIAIAQKIGEKIGVMSSVPTEYDGIPVLNNMKAWFFAYKEKRKADDITNIWNIFESAVHYADNPSEELKARFIGNYNRVIKQLGVKWNLTMGLYWIRPFAYLNLDETNRTYITQKNSPYSNEITKISNLKQLPDANMYLSLIKYFQEKFNDENCSHSSFPELSLTAWKASQKKGGPNASFLKWFAPLLEALENLGGTGTPDEVRNQIISNLGLPDEIVNETRGKNEGKKFDNEVAFARNYLVYEGYIDKSVRGKWALTESGRNAPMDEGIASEIFKKWSDKFKKRREEGAAPTSDVVNKKDTKYWIYAPGHNASKWDEFHSEGIMGIGWDELDDLKQYPSKDAMKNKFQQLYGTGYTYKNKAHATWQFANELLPGDIVYAKQGNSKVIGRGIVESEYMYDPSRREFKHIHKVNWKNKGEWQHPGQAANKTLTEISSYTDYVRKLENLFSDDMDEMEEKVVDYDRYTDNDFLNEVFMDENQYNTLVDLLGHKRNIILQGAPGVGKTFSAKRLAYSMIGEKDVSRVMMVQFHQSYSYEDFIMGYRPTSNGFELSTGPFYDFCKRALEDDDRKYFFIIDEINRGNLSKIFGELLMLIEKDKRGQKIRLLYSDELFSVPKNVYIIGMMNTADRSLAMIDYALRRRFAFYSLEPAFDSIGFQAIGAEVNNPKFNALVNEIQLLNSSISNDESLGKGFRIGHSYLCTDDQITDKWLSSVVEYELLPLLDEYWFDEPSKVEHWSKKLRGALHD
ncbi:hypothetical protein GCM10011351_28450 [Paraliobacillus quinghaiensis]|uniref:AAA+ ATPase domain-containing protein n=1 Tax=Paraliobacillus quinghaiensis TaxID=470815 RepID=A0A917WYN7_9BACI|nr:AAA family ATPase [Paraliobacillus quinghaiensis]GGM40561.1 hypothetical protein GCM10011351_28450 [Paraliobacillus quinghaiensis]